MMLLDARVPPSVPGPSEGAVPWEDTFADSAVVRGLTRLFVLPPFCSPSTGSGLQTVTRFLRR